MADRSRTQSGERRRKARDLSKLGIYRRVVGGVVLALLVLGSIEGSWTALRMYSEALEEARNNAERSARLAAAVTLESFAAGDIGTVQSTIDELLGEKRGFVCAEVVGSDEQDIARRCLREEGVFAKDLPVIVAKAPIVLRDEEGRELLRFGSIALTVDRSLLEDRIFSELVQLLLRRVVLLSLSGLTLVILLDRTVLRPLAKLNEHTQRLARGDFSQPVERVSRDELGDLAVGLEQMRQHVLESRERIERQRDELEEALDTKRRFLTSISHELRTPLHGVLGFAEELRKSPPEDAEAREECLRAITTSARSLQGAVGQLLDHDAFERNAIETHAKEVETAALAHEVLTRFRAEATTAQLQFGVELAPDLPRTIHTDETHLRAILDQLVGNAVKYTQAGEIDLRMGRELLPTGESSLRICVDDTGTGIPQEKLEAIFEPFQRLETDMARSTGGTGLGLSIARKLAEALGGELHAERRKVAGTRMVLRLPLSKDEVQASEAAAAPDEAARAAERDPPPPQVLVVDDNALNRRLATLMLDRIGFGHDTANDGVEAVELLQASPERWSLVLMDCQMPQMDGYDATRAIREMPAVRSDLPIVAYTAHAVQGELERCLDSGMDAMLSKPVDAEVFERTLRQQLAR